MADKLTMDQRKRPDRIKPKVRVRKMLDKLSTRIAVICGLTLALVAQSNAQKPFVRNGNIYLLSGAGEPKALTSSGQDAEPVLSPDGKWIVFVRALPGKEISTGVGSPATELWQISADGKNATLLVRSKESDRMESVLANFSNLQFSTDGRYVFFLSDAWATSGALHVVDTTNGKERFVCPAGGFEVIRSGEYRDCLLVSQHRYFIGGGSYDWWWLVRPNGKEVGPVGEDTESFKATYLEQ